jgi:hypothetical protein
MELLMALLESYTDIFTEPRGLPPPCRHDHRIRLLPETPPVVVRPYRYLQLLKDEIERQCDDMLQQGIIHECTSTYSSPVLQVKEDKSWHFCVDYREINSKMVKDKFLIPVVDELLDKLRGACFFTKLDLQSGYHQVRMHPDDIDKTAFRTHRGQLEFLVMPFSLTNAPSMFQSLMNGILKPFIRKFVLVFFDDILVFSSSWVEHLQHVKQVFEVLREHKLALKRPKCSFREESVVYLEHIISAADIAMDPAKVAAVEAWPRPPHTSGASRLPRPHRVLPQVHRGLQRGGGTPDGPLEKRGLPLAKRNKGGLLAVEASPHDDPSASDAQLLQALHCRLRCLRCGVWRGATPG